MMEFLMLCVLFVIVYFLIKSYGGDIMNRGCDLHRYLKDNCSGCIKTAERRRKKLYSMFEDREK